MPPNPHRLPADIRYGVDDIPSLLTTWVQALQHLALAVGLGLEVFPEAARHAPVPLVPVLSSSLVCGT